MKILVLGDIHGKIIWEDIIDKENPDKTVFLGDYVCTHDNISSEQQLSNLEDILNYKEKNSDKVILLRGNHDVQHLGYYWARCSGFDQKVGYYMAESNFKERFLKLTQWIHIDDDLKVIFSHAGISSVWMNNSNINSVYDINKLEPSELFRFTPDSIFDYYGNSVTQPLTWIRPQSLCKCNISGWDQVVGHTPVTKIVNINKSTKEHRNIWLCDNLDQSQYLIINNNELIPSKL